MHGRCRTIVSDLTRCCALLLAAILAAPVAGQAPPVESAGAVTRGERIKPASFGPAIVETMDEVVARDLERRRQGPNIRGARGDAHGIWVVPSRRATFYPHSGIHNVVNKWGDTSMGIDFPRPASVHGVYVAGQAARGVWTTGLRASGFRDSVLVAQTEWFENIDATPDYFAIDFEEVDRVVFESRPVLDGAGWYALDDLAFTMASDDPAAPVPERTVLDFEDCAYRQVLTGSAYYGLTWETGTGDFRTDQAVHAPMTLPDEEPSAPRAAAPAAPVGGGTLPVLDGGFQGVIRGDASSYWYPPDTCGAIGLTQFVEVVNGNFAVYDRDTGAELVNVQLGSFFNDYSVGDPRVIWDHFSGRFIVAVSEFDTTLYIAVSTTDDATGAWFKTSFVASIDDDDGCWPDYETLGADQNGIYTTSYMVGCGEMTIFALQKAPMIAPTPGLGVVTAFRNLPYEGAIQPTLMLDPSGSQYFISRVNATSLRLRRIQAPLSAPSLVDLGTVGIASHSIAPDVPALGSTTDISVIDNRILNAVYRNGSIWATHDVSTSYGTAGCRWYQIDPIAKTVLQYGTVEDPDLNYFYGSISVNADDGVVMAFSGANADQYVGCYYTGRLADDPPGAMAVPALLHDGFADYNRVDSYGRNRWGDYSLTTVDPLNDLGFFSIQEYVHATNSWGTWIGRFSFCTDAPAVDCNYNCILDADDLASGTSPDCNANGVPDECDLAAASLDCNVNDIPDECEDCNGNGVADECDLATYYSETSPQLTPLGLGSDGVHTFVSPLERSADVILNFEVSADLSGSTQSVVVYLNENEIGEIFKSGAGSCPDPPDAAQIVVPQAQFDGIVGTGDATIRMEALYSDPFACGGNSWITVNMQYPALTNLDLNGNGLIDACECAEDCAAAGPDTKVTVADLLDLLANWGTSPAACDIAPTGGDGVVDVADLLALLAAWGNCAP